MFNLKKHKIAQIDSMEEIGNLANRTDITNFQSDLNESLDTTDKSLKGDLSKEEAESQYLTDEEKQQMFNDVQFFAYAKKVYDTFGDRPELHNLLASRVAPNPTEAQLIRVEEILNKIRTDSVSPEENVEINTVDAQNVATRMFDADKPRLLSILNEMQKVQRSAKANKTVKLSQTPPLMNTNTEEQLIPILPVEDIGDFISKLVKIVLSGNEQQFNQAQSEIVSNVSSDLEQEAQSAFDSLKFYLGKTEEEKEIVGILTQIYGLIPTVQSSEQINTDQGMIMPQEEPIMASKKFNLSKYMYDQNDGLKKEAYTNLGDAYVLYGPTEKRVCPKLSGRGGGKVGGSNVVSEETCRYHCLDGIVIDDNKTICGEALWRANVADKFSREYVDKDGNIVGGYLNKRFEIDRNVPEENKMRLKPGETRKPRPAAWGTTESRMQDMRNKEGQKRGYSPTNTGEPFDWQTDVDQNNVNQDQETRNQREEAMGHQLVQYTKRDQGENNPKMPKTAQVKDEKSKDIKTAFNLKKHKTSSENIVTAQIPESKISNDLETYRTLSGEIGKANTDEELQKVSNESGNVELPNYFQEKLIKLMDEKRKQLLHSENMMTDPIKRVAKAKENVKSDKDEKDFEYKGEKFDVNPFAVCNKSTGGKKEAGEEKFESCVKKVKEKSKVSFNLKQHKTAKPISEEVGITVPVVVDKKKS